MLKFRLSTMMFLEYFVPGATVPILSLYLRNHLGFQPQQIGAILAMPAIAGMCAPFIVSHIADRWISSERLLGLHHVLAAAVMVALSYQKTFIPFLALYFVYGLLFTPTFGLTNTIALHQVDDPKRDFGGIRMWGTAGWVVVGWVFGYFWLRGGANPSARLPHALYVSALSSCLFAAYALTLPRSNVRAKDRSSFMYWKALKVFARPGLLLLCVLTLINSMVHQFYYFGMSPFLSQIGFRSEHIMPAMSLGQFSEVFVLGLLGYCLTRLTIKQAMIIGALAQAVRYIAFAVGSPFLIIVGIGLHGVCYAFFFTAGYLYVDQHSTAETRAGAQQLFTIMISGIGVMLGSFGSGIAGELFKAPAAHVINYQQFWMLPSLMGFAVTIVLALFFKEVPEKKAEA
jgi:nucleoside transporter